MYSIYIYIYALYMYSIYTYLAGPETNRVEGWDSRFGHLMALDIPIQCCMTCCWVTSCLFRTRIRVASENLSLAIAPPIQDYLLIEWRRGFPILGGLGRNFLWQLVGVNRFLWWFQPRIWRLFPYAGRDSSPAALRCAVFGGCDLA